MIRKAVVCRKTFRPCINYRIDATRVFRSLGHHFSQPFPTTANIPITAVFWSNEATGKDGAIWVDIHQMKMLTAAQAAADASEEIRMVESVAFGPGTEPIQLELEQSCLDAPGCAGRFNAASE